MRSRELHNHYNYRCSSWTDHCFLNDIYNSLQLSIRLVIKGILQTRLRNADPQAHGAHLKAKHLQVLRWENTGDGEATVEVLLNATMQMIRRRNMHHWDYIKLYHILYLHDMIESQISWTLEDFLECNIIWWWQISPPYRFQSCSLRAPTLSVCGDDFVPITNGLLVV